MNKVLFFALIVFIISCSSPIEAPTEDLGIVSPDNMVRIEITTTEPNDEVKVNYYVYQTDDYNLNVYPFSYDAQGNAEPIVIRLDNYDFRYIQGETYRNRASDASPLSLKIFLNDEVIVEETSEVSTTNRNGLIRFNYDIVKKESI
ncbi:hypothetical protein [Polaribacter sp. M15]